MARPVPARCLFFPRLLSQLLRATVSLSPRRCSLPVLGPECPAKFAGISFSILMSFIFLFPHKERIPGWDLYQGLCPLPNPRFFFFFQDNFFFFKDIFFWSSFRLTSKLSRNYRFSFISCPHMQGLPYCQHLALVVHRYNG